MQYNPISIEIKIEDHFLKVFRSGKKSNGLILNKILFVEAKCMTAFKEIPQQ